MSSSLASLNCPNYNGYVYCDGINPPTCRTCPTASCGLGRELSFDCRTQLPGNMLVPVCQGCRPGTENPLGQAAACTACNAGFYAPTNGTVSCQACAYKPPNSVYVAWDSSTPATSSACPWACDAGFYLAGGGQCVGCPAGVYKLFANNLTSCGVACTNANAISNSYYVQAAAGGSSSSCPWCVVRASF